MKVPEKNSSDYSPSPSACLSVPTGAAGRRLDQVLAALRPEYSRNRLQGWIRDGQVKVDGVVVCEPKVKLLGGEVLTVFPAAVLPRLPDAPEDIPLEVVFEDDALLVINKPAGLVVHPGNGNADGTLMNALLHRLPALAEVPRAGIVHRLDKETSGLMVVAKTLMAQTDLVRQLQARSVRRQYWALVKGQVEKSGTVDAAIGRHPVHRTRMALVSESRGGKPAVTHYRIVRRYAHCTLTECSLETGRTHQIRVHMASLGHPLVGDPVYGRKDPRLPGFSRQALHAFRLGLNHPGTGEALSWEIGLPADFQDLLAQLDAA